MTERINKVIRMPEKNTALSLLQVNCMGIAYTGQIKLRLYTYIYTNDQPH